MDDDEEEMVVQRHCSHFTKHQFSTDSTEIDVFSSLILKVCEFYIVVEVHVRRKARLYTVFDKVTKNIIHMEPNSQIILLK